MAKIVFVNIPAHGHTNPTLAVTRALVERGHQVLYYTGEDMRGKVVPTGADFRPYPDPMPTSKEVAEALAELVTTTLLLTEMSERHTGWFVAEMRREEPDAIVYDSTSMWGYVAARILGIPHICSITTFVLDGSLGSMPWSALARFIVQSLPRLPRLARWKRHMVETFGKENVGGITEYSRCNLVYTARAFHPENRRLDERFRFVGPTFDPEARSEEFPFDAAADRPLVYVSLGTVTNDDLAFYRATFEAFKDFPARFILSAGQKIDLSRLGSAPDNFVVRASVPQIEVLRRASAFITHGGMNSVHEGLFFGVPEIVVPHQIEQLLNGVRVAQVGAGLLLGARAPYGRVTAVELRDALRRVLTTPSFKEKATAMGAALRDAGGHRRAVEEIERFIGVSSDQAT